VSAAPPVPGAPPAELSRSAAAAAVGRHAAASGLFFSHFERRRDLALPEPWEVRDRPDLGPYPWDPEGGWRDGVLPETKFRSFRLDRRIASLHPAHGPEWTAHELCHGLVGFAWAPGHTRLWHATAARLGELLPVALYYFFDGAGFDGAGLPRCPVHEGAAVLFEQRCADCEAIAAAAPPGGPVPADHPLYAAGRAYVRAEIARARRSLEVGLPLAHRYATLDLSTDGLAYVSAHGPVIESDAYARWIGAFLQPDQGWHPTLDALIDRIEAVMAAITEGAPLAPWAGGPWRRAAQDVGWRLIQLREEVEGEAADGLDALIDTLANDQTEAGVEAAIAGYEALFEDWELPEADELFGVGYDLPRGVGRCQAQIQAGLRSALPETLRRLGRGADAAIAAFTAADGWARRPLADRFADFIEAHHPALTDQARVEAALCAVEAEDPAERSLALDPPAPGPWRRTRGVRALHLTSTVRTLDGGLHIDASPEAPAGLAVVRRAGEVHVLDLRPDEARALIAAGAPQPLEALGLADKGQNLQGHGLISPTGWAVRWG
jgi:hypothetical protein